jgi:hypothetical protein
VLRRVFGPKREEVVRDWRRLHNEELHNLYASQNIYTAIKSRWKVWAGHIVRMGEVRNACKIFVGKPERKRQLRRLGHKWEGMDLREMWWEVVDLRHLDQDGEHWQASVNTVMNLRVP